MDFVLTLHSHLPWVLHHGRWPHGSDWLCEAALDTYLPLLEVLERMELERVASPLTVGVTPVLANQLAHPDLTPELEAFLAQRLEACDQATSDFEASGEVELLPSLFDQSLESLARAYEERRQRDVTKLEQMVVYAQTAMCRTRVLLDALGECLKRSGVAKVRTMLRRDNNLLMSFFRSQGMMAGPFLQLEKDLDEPPAHPAEAAKRRGRP